MSNVVGLHGQPVASDGQPVQSVVDALETLLAAARAGDITGICVADADQLGRVGYHIVGLAGGFAMIGALQVMGQILAEQAMEGIE